MNGNIHLALLVTANVAGLCTALMQFLRARERRRERQEWREWQMSLREYQAREQDREGKILEMVERIERNTPIAVRRFE